MMASDKSSVLGPGSSGLPSGVLLVCPCVGVDAGIGEPRKEQIEAAKWRHG